MMQSRKMFTDCNLELDVLLSNKFLTSQLYCKNNVL